MYVQGSFECSFCKNKVRPNTVDGCEPYFTGWNMGKFVIKLNKADSCVRTKSNDIVMIENIVTSKLDKKILIIGRKFDKLTNFFNNPCPSQLLNIQAGSELSHLRSWILSDIEEKMMCLPLPDTSISIIIPLLHFQ